MTTPSDANYVSAAGIIYDADDTTSSYRNHEVEGIYEVQRLGDFYGEHDELRAILVALLQRIQAEYRDAPDLYRYRVDLFLRRTLAAAPADFEHRSHLIAAMILISATRGVPPENLVADNLLNRRLFDTTRLAAEMVVGLIGTEAERRAAGLAPDPEAVMADDPEWG